MHHLHTHTSIHHTHTSSLYTLCENMQHAHCTNIKCKAVQNVCGACFVNFVIPAKHMLVHLAKNKPPSKTTPLKFSWNYWKRTLSLKINRPMYTVVHAGCSWLEIDFQKWVMLASNTCLHTAILVLCETPGQHLLWAGFRVICVTVLLLEVRMNIVI